MVASSLTTDSPTLSNLQQMHRRIEARLVTLRTKVATDMWESQACYKADCHCRVRETPCFKISSYVFIDKPLLDTSESSTDALARSTNNKLLRRTSRSHRILKVRASTVTVDEHGIPNTVSVDRVAHASSPQHNIGHYEKPHNAEQTNLHEAPSAKPASQPHTTDTYEHVVDNFIQYLDQGRKTRYVVRCYTYRPTKDMVESADPCQDNSSVLIAKIMQSKIIQSYFISKNYNFEC